MDNNYQYNNLPGQEPSVWADNPYLKMLLLVLIFVFLGSSIFLAVLQQVQLSNRQKIYNDAVASLPKHLVNQTASSTELTEVAGWKTYKNDKYGFEFQYPSDAYINYDSTAQSSKNSQAMVGLSSHNYSINWAIRIFLPFVWYNDPAHPPTQISVDGKQCQKNNGKGQVVEILCHDGNYDLAIDFGVENPELVTSKPLSFYEEMLGTFKFNPTP